MGADAPPFAASTRGNEAVLRLGVGADASALFELAADESDALAEFRISAKALAAADSKTLGDVRTSFALRRRGPAVVAEFAARRDADPELGYAPDVEGASWSSPIRSYEGPDEDCIADVSAALADVLGATAQAAPTSRVEILRKGVEETEPSQRCADASPLVRKRNEELEALVIGLFAEPSRNVPHSTTDMPLMSGVRVVVSEGGLTVDGQDIDSHAEDHVNEALLHHLEDRAEKGRVLAAARGEEFEGRIQLEVAADLPFTRAMDVMWSAHQAGFRDPLIVATSDSGTVGLPVSAPATWLGKDAVVDLPDVLVTASGVRIRTPGGTTSLPPDDEKLEAFAQTYVAAGSEGERTRVRVRIEAHTPMQTVVSTLDALRGNECSMKAAISMEEDGLKHCLLYHPIVDLDPPFAGG